MTQEQKQLLLRDLFARLAYGAFVQFEVDGQKAIKPLTVDFFSSTWYHTEFIKPFLRPLSSMMQGEWEEMTALIYPYGRVNLNNKNELLLWLSAEENDMPIMLMDNVFSWLDKNMFDYRGLIPMGLALEAPKNMYKI